MQQRVSRQAHPRQHRSSRGKPCLQPVLPHRHLDVQLAEGAGPVGPVLHLKHGTRNKCRSAIGSQVQNQCGGAQFGPPDANRQPWAKQAGRFHLHCSLEQGHLTATPGTANVR